MSNLDLTEDQVLSATDEADALHFRPSIGTLFLPTIVIAFGYGFVWLWLFVDGQGHTSLARLCMFVLLLGVPLMSAYNLMRLATVGIKTHDDYVRVHPGFPVRDATNIPYAFIENIDIHRSFLGRWTQSATLKISLSAGKPIYIASLKHPNQARSAIVARAMNC
jgi:membrane protein YdbS with pleckstrin-like domain